MKTILHYTHLDKQLMELVLLSIYCLFKRAEHRFYICNNQINFKFSSIHAVKSPENFYHLHERFYDESSELKEISCDEDGMIQ